MPVTEHVITIKKDQCGILRAQADCRQVGRVDDNNATRLRFVWPEAYDGYTAIVHFSHGDEWVDVLLGADRTVPLTEQLTQYESLEVTLRFEGNGFRESCGTCKFMLAPIPNGREPIPVPWPTPWDEAFFGVATAVENNTVTQTFKNKAGKMVGESSFAVGGSTEKWIEDTDQNTPQARIAGKWVPAPAPDVGKDYVDEQDQTLAASIESVKGQLHTRLDGLDEAKVDKVKGMGLSENSYSGVEKAKLAALGNYDDTEIRQHVTALSGAVDDHVSNNENPHGVTKAQVGLGNVEDKAMTAANTGVKDAGGYWSSDNVEGVLGEVGAAQQQLFTSVSNGKTALVADIRSKGGVVTPVGDSPTFEELGAGIKSIPQTSPNLCTNNLPSGVYSGVTITNLGFNTMILNGSTSEYLRQDVFTAGVDGDPIPVSIGTYLFLCQPPVKGISMGITFQNAGFVNGDSNYVRVSQNDYIIKYTIMGSTTSALTNDAFFVGIFEVAPLPPRAS